MFKKGSHLHHDLSQIILLALPFIIYLYPAVTLLTAKSSTPVFFKQVLSEFASIERDYRTGLWGISIWHYG
jgi:hypothetical protein